MKMNPQNNFLVFRNEFWTDYKTLRNFNKPLGVLLGEVGDLMSDVRRVMLREMRQKISRKT